MIQANQSLEDKAAIAVARYLSAVPALKGVEVTAEITDAIKKDGTIVVSAKRTGQVGGQGAGIYALDVSVEFRMIRNVGKRTASVFQQRAADVLASFDRKNPFDLASQITSSLSGEFHCYYVQLNGTDRQPVDDEHRLDVSLAMEAMPVSYATGLQNNKSVDRRA